MATFPSYVKIGWRDMQEQPQSVVDRHEMDRGIPKQRRRDSDVRIELQLVLHFDSKTDTANFETWFFDTIHAGADFFDFVHPRTAATIQARFKGGELGPLTYRRRTLDYASRPATLEYWRSAW